MMTKTELLSRLKKISPNQCQTRGLFTLIVMFIDYFKDASVPEYDGLGIFHFLPKHLARAVEILRSSKDRRIDAFRKQYLRETEDEEVPSLTEIQFGGLARTGLCYTLSRELPKLLLGEECTWLEKDMYAYFTAQDTIVKQMIDRFDNEVYQGGLCAIIDESKMRGMAGTFGKTSLRSYGIAGRLMFTLARPRKDSKVEYSVSFVGEDRKTSEPRFGIQSFHADLMTTMSMFEDVINGWPKNSKDQKKIYKNDKEVSMI